MYVSNQKALEYFEKRMNLRSAEQGANLILMLPYYKHSALHDSRIIDGLRVVSDIKLQPRQTKKRAIAAQNEIKANTL